MQRNCLAAALVLLLAAVCLPLPANPANGDPRLERLYSKFMSPCCWSEDLRAHHSPKADELRAEIAAMVAQGKSDGEIQSALTARYTARILSLPEGARRTWLFLIPPLAAAAGLAGIVFYLRRARAEATAAAAGLTEHLPELPESEWS